ncbi:(E2-independent) E3 ubiquitin-conjugating enzyme FATS isoform X7 [Canis lupus familiaris]|uniref:(E2-independent) E3 ubiquitin-conjugating enzyme FATS isoform X7 n=1 Tax=Canis lupus familiaris TaxID=9615 RepID=UPI0018F3D3B6|nr:(E2-independent) E3 ubiquitin-conjugating enzyme FATS isoform X7 [Canis lupus familiaris]
MRHPGIPTNTHQEGCAARHSDTAGHPTFQIRAFSTGLRNHVMVMDFVKSNWFPAQRRAQVCIIQMYQGLETAEWAAGRYEIHSRLFSSPKDHSAWERNEGLSHAAWCVFYTHVCSSNYHSHQDRTCPVSQRAPSRPLRVQTYHLHNPPGQARNILVINRPLKLSQMSLKRQWNMIKLSEEGLRDNRYTTNDRITLKNLQSDVTEKKSDFTEETLASQNTKMISSIVISQLIDENKSKATRAALQVPCAPAPRAHPQASVGLPPGEPGPPRGFASITITARRVGPPAGSLAWEAQGALLAEPCAPAAPRGHQGPCTCAELSRTCSVMRLKVPETQPRLCEAHGYWVTNLEDNQEDAFPPGAPQAGKGPLVFSSCVHLRVSQQCPSSGGYLDGALPGPAQQPQRAGPKMHRSVLSLHLSCSSHRLTPDGADGPANGAPLCSALKQELTQRSPDLPGRHWNPGLQESFLKENPALEQVHLGPSACPCSGSRRVEDRAFSDVGVNQVTVSKGREDYPDCGPGRGASQLAIHIPGWSYATGDYKCCDLVVKIKECRKSEEPEPAPPEPAPPKPATPEPPETPDLSEDHSEGQRTPVGSLTLQEALETRKPQFISRSQERLKKLEHMVQQRKAQRKENLGQKQTLFPVRTNKKQFTVPHPLSDNLFKPKERYISEKEMHMRSKRCCVSPCTFEGDFMRREAVSPEGLDSSRACKKRVQTWKPVAHGSQQSHRGPHAGLPDAASPAGLVALLVQTPLFCLAACNSRPPQFHQPDAHKGGHSL